MKRKVYLETSVVSYLMAWRSRDLVIAGNQETTREWWTQRDKFDLFISQFVLDEAAAGDGNAAAQRLRALEGIPELAVVEQVVDIAEALLFVHLVISRLSSVHHKNCWRPNEHA